MKQKLVVLGMFLIAVLMLMPISTLAQQSTRTPTRTPTPDEPFLLENVPIRSSGIEVFPNPRRSGRIFATTITAFAPHVAGINAEGTWLYIYYFDRGVLKAAWSPVRALNLTAEERESLPVIDPVDAPELPDLEFNERASRPYGVNQRVTVTVAPPAAPPPDNGGGNNPPPQPTSPPQPTAPPPNQTDEP